MSIKIIKLGEELSLKSFLISLFFVKLYLVNFGPFCWFISMIIKDEDEDWGKATYVGLIRT